MVDVDRLPLMFVRALDVAAEYEGATAPNPPVGCVILDVDGNELAIAAHQKAGQPHAEALAIQKCREAGLIERIHTLIVTLEPCNHQGRTPACTNAILATPAKHVWIGASDPNSHVKGGGAAYLSALGLEVRFWSELDHRSALRAQRLIAPFAKYQKSGWPWVTVKQALNIHGAMIPPLGEKTFTSEASLIYAHQLRKRADAIISGSGTVLADAPLFTVRRVADFAGKRRTLVLMDRRQRIPSEYITAATARGFDVMRCGSITEALQRLGDAGAMEVLVEAGPQLMAAVLSSGLWDEHILIKQSASHTMGDEISVTLNVNETKEFADVLRHY
jgi:diaminohydroxyphosphoribosylaminopyrimidine deaminase/5-amino-6-(5-phosphoribosylamino)uracil reductase